MRVCDICGAPAVDRITTSMDHQEFDLCKSHMEKIIQYMADPAVLEVPESDKKRGKAPKNKKE
jgi:hypothetical protein